MNNFIIYTLILLSYTVQKKIRFSTTKQNLIQAMGNEVCSLLNELNVIKDRDDIRKAKTGVRKMRQQLHGAAREECVPFSLVTEDQLNFLLRVLESAEGRAKMRMLLRGVIEEREVLVDSIEDVMYRDMEGEDVQTSVWNFLSALRRIVSRMWFGQMPSDVHSQWSSESPHRPERWDWFSLQNNKKA